jgi:hypothetical protein
MPPEAGDCTPQELNKVNLRIVHKISICGFFVVAMLTTRQLSAQYLTLEGQTGGFLTPTAYVVESAKGHILSHPAVGFHFIDAAAVIGNVETFSVTEGFANRAEAGYTRSVHQLGNQMTTGLGLSNLWNYNGMNIFHGKVVAIKDGQFGSWMPGVAVGGVVRTGDNYVSGSSYLSYLSSEFGITLAPKTYSNGDVYVAVTKTWAKKPVPFLANIGWKATNATIFGLGGQSTRFGGRIFGGLGIPLPIGKSIVVVPSAGFTQEPKTSKNLSNVLLAPPTYATHDRAHIPTTLDYAIRVTQREHPHFAFDIGVGQVAGNIGTTFNGVSLVPVNLQARHVVGTGLSYRF